MTTIVTDGRAFYADSRVSNDAARIFNQQAAKVVIRGTKGYAFSGPLALMHPVIDWYEDGADPEKIPASPEWTLWVVIDRKDVFELTRDIPYPDLIVTFPEAIGSGARYALGAMAAGAVPTRAIQIAAMFDARTGGPINTLKFDEIPTHVQTRAKSRA